MNRVMVTNLNQLWELAEARRAVGGEHRMLKNSLPAAVVLNMSGTIIHSLMDAGMYVYEAKRKRKIKGGQA